VKAGAAADAAIALVLRRQGTQVKSLPMLSEGPLHWGQAYRIKFFRESVSLDGEVLDAAKLNSVSLTP
jgi:hypothetical protein